MPAQKLPSFLQRILYGGISGDEDPKAKTQVFIFNSFSLIGFLSVIVFGLVHIYFEDNGLLGALEIVGGIAMALNLVALRLTRNVFLASHLLLLTVFSLLLILLITGGVFNTGIYWYFTFIPAAYFLLGKSAGSVWILVLAAATLILVGLGSLGLVKIAYTFVEVRQLLVVLFIVTVLIYLYQSNKQKIEEKLAEQDQSKSEFIALASHQLRTPITAISWFSEMLLERESGELNAEQRDQINHIYLSNQRLTLIVEAMLTVSSLELKSLVIKPELIDIGEAAHKIIVKEQSSQKINKRLEIEENYDHGLEKLYYDPFIFKTVVQNLISNAIKYTPGGGKVSLQILKEGDKLLIKVTDTGLGIPKEDQEKVFTKFYRADNAKAVETDGTGLGLYIVKSLVEYVGGNIKLESKEEKGTTFLVVLPEQMLMREEVKTG